MPSPVFPWGMVSYVIQPDMEDYSAIERDKPLACTATWVNYTGGGREKKQSEKDINCMIPFLQHSRNNIIIEMESRLVVAKGFMRVLDVAKKLQCKAAFS